MASYRRTDPKRAEWREWLRKHSDLIAAAGLPEFVVQDEARWWDFLMHGGHLEHHPAPQRFDVRDLGPRQQATLLRLVLEDPVSCRSIEQFLTMPLILKLLDLVAPVTARGQLPRDSDPTYRGEWQPWLDVNAALIDASGIPWAVLADEEEWQRFVGWGLSDRYDPAGFTLADLSRREKLMLLRLILRWREDAYMTALARQLLPDLVEAINRRFVE